MKTVRAKEVNKHFLRSFRKKWLTAKFYYEMTLPLKQLS